MADPGFARRGGGKSERRRQDYLSGAPPLVGKERAKKFGDLQTLQMAGNGTSRVF